MDTSEFVRQSYDGEFESGFPNGKGKLTTSDGTIYIGEFANGEASGLGKQTKPDGTVYEGDWDCGLIRGMGKLTSPDGSVYEGEFEYGDLQTAKESRPNRMAPFMKVNSSMACQKAKEK